MKGKPRVLAGKWEDRGSTLEPPFRCRWFFSWTELDDKRVVGFFAGYEGGGAFIEERFHASFHEKRLVEFVWNGRDHAADQDRSYVPLPAGIEHHQDEHFDVFMQWHDPVLWEEGSLYLAPGKENILTLPPGSLLLEPNNAVRNMGRIQALARHTGILSSF